MRKTARTLVLCFILSGLAAAPSAGGRVPQAKSAGGGPEKGSTLRIISSSHQDIAWMNSPEACREYRDVHCITPALEIMARNPDYCFVMENMLNLMEYLERHPERRDEVLKYTHEGRLEWGATFNQPYESLLSGEQLIRETYFGRKWLTGNFPGCDARVYFNPDVPGRALQMQQILSKAGIPDMIISRYHEGLYKWASPDGSSVTAYSPGHYSNAAGILGASPAEAVKALEERLAKWSAYYRQRRLPPEFPLLHSVDFSQPTDFGPLIEAWDDGHRSASGGPSSTMRYSSARKFFEALSRTNPVLDLVAGARPNLWLYIHGPTHHWAVSAQREAGVVLPAAEIFNTALALLDGGFGEYPQKDLNEAWMAAIYPDHGWGGKEGQITDRLFRKKYEFARDTGRRLVDTAIGKIASRVAVSREKGTAVILFNSLSWKRTEPVVIRVPSARESWQVLDDEGQVRAAQYLTPAADGSPRLEFVASDVPALGYKTFYLVKSESDSASVLRGSPMSSIYENDFYRVELAPGGIKRIYDKALQRDVLNTEKFLGFEVFTMRSAGNGAGEFGRVQQPTMDGFDKLSLHETRWRHDSAESGALRAVFTLEQPLSNCTIHEKLIIYNHDKRIDAEVSILGWDGDPYREFRLAVPVNAPGGTVAYEVPMGVVEVGKSEIAGTGGPAYGNLNYDELCAEIRPREVQNFIDASGPDFGLTLATSVAVNDFKDPTPDPVPYPLLQPVLLASRRSCHGEGNWYLQEGDHHYRFSIYSHAGGWANGWRRGVEANAPLFVVVAPERSAGASLPERQSFFSITSPNALVSTVKKCQDDDSVVVRLYEIEGRAAEVEMRTPFAFGQAEAVNIIEEEPKPLPLEKNGLKITLGHHVIETLKLRPAVKSRRAAPSAQNRHFRLIPPGETAEDIVRAAANIVPTSNQLAWQEMEFIAFAHFGMNTFTDREWGEGTEDPALFNPTDFDARQWVKVLKDAGLKMLILTAKHHDGFCLWPSKFTEHSVKNSPWRGGRGDVVREVADACREAGLKVGVYLSPWDRHEPTYGDSPAYNEHFRNQLRELLSGYGEISEVWFDGACGEGPNGKRQTYDWPSYYRVVRELQPRAVIFGMGPDIRWVGTESGYGRETEWSVVPVKIRDRAPAADGPEAPGAVSERGKKSAGRPGPSSPPFSLDELFLPGDMTATDLGSREKLKEARALAWYPAETDVSIRPGWFYHAREDGEVKPPEKLLDIYFSSVGRNSVLLLNVPPDRRGRITGNDARSLLGLRRILDETFGANLAAGAKVRASSEAAGHPASSILDADKVSSWRPENGADSATIEFDLGSERSFDVAVLQEDIRAGQRVEEFAVEAWNGRAWAPVARGTTIGYKRLLRFPETTTRKLRLVISKSRAEPTLAAFGLFRLRTQTRARPTSQS
jgi:alpha-mannosidase